MPIGKAIWGIDMGHAALKALKLRAVGADKVEVVAFDYIEHAKMLSQPDADRDALIAEALETFSSRHQLAKEPLVVAVPGQQTLARFTKLPPVEPKKIPDIVRYEAEQQIPFDMDEVVWDFQAFTDKDSPDVEVGIFAMKRELIHEYMSHYTALNMETKIVQSGPLAMYNALRFEGRCGDDAVVILDIGAQNTDLIVASGPSLWTRTINIGGNQFTETLVKAFKLSFQKAEALKRTASSSKYARQIFQAMRPVFADLVAEIQRSIGFYSSSHRDVKLKRVFGTGNAFKMPGLQKFLQQSLGMEVTRVSEFEKLAPPSEGNTTDFTENTLTFCVAYGLALQGLGLAEIESNLLPPEISRQTVWHKKNPWFAAAAAMLAMAAGTVWFRYMLDTNALAAAGTATSPPPMQLEQAKQIFSRTPDDAMPSRDFAYEWLAVANTFKAEFNRLKGEREKVDKLIDRYQEMHDGRQTWLQVLNELHQALPFEPALEQAATPEAYRQAIASNPRGLDRGKRQEIFIQELRSLYSERVYETLETMADPRAASARGDARRGEQRPRGPAGSGFAIQLKVRTPNEEGATFVERTLGQQLQREDWPDTYDFYFDKIRVASAVTLKDEAASRRASRRSTVAVATDEPTETFIDPVTGESAANDWLCDIHLAVVFGERKDAKPKSGATDETAAEDAPADAPAADAPPAPEAADRR